MDDPTVKAEFQKLVQALGDRFDALPGLDPMDIGSVGLWGEWHNWATSISSINGNAPGSVGSQIPMSPLATCEWYVDQFFTYFSKTIKIMLNVLGSDNLFQTRQSIQKPACVISRQRTSSLGERQVKAYPRTQTDRRTVGKANGRRIIGAFRKTLFWYHLPVCVDLFGFPA